MMLFKIFLKHTKFVFRMKKLFWVIWYFIIQFSFGQQTSVAKNKFIRNHITGFKQNSVKSIVEDHNGMVWIAAIEMGIYRYDRNSFHEVQGSFLLKRIKSLILD